MNALAHLSINQHMKFVVPSFTNSKDMIDGQNVLMSHTNPSMPIRRYFVIPRLTVDMFYLYYKKTTRSSAIAKRPAQCSESVNMLSYCSMNYAC